MLLIVFEDSDLCKARLAEMLFAVDNTTMDYESLERYVDTLSYSDDPRAEGVIRDLIDRALDQITQAPSEAAADFLRAAAHTLVFELGKPMPVDQRRRVAKLGISLALQS
jgi:hypothetical protein